LANRYWTRGLIIFAGLWAFILLAAAGEAIYTRISVPVHHRTLVDLLVVERSLVQTQKQLGQVEAWAECLVQATERLAEDAAYLSTEYRRPKTTTSPDAPARCNDPR
jgi:hypothetical protein